MPEGLENGMTFLQHQIFLPNIQFIGCNLMLSTAGIDLATHLIEDLVHIGKVVDGELTHCDGVALNIAVVRRQLEEGRINVISVEGTEVPEDASVAVLELDILLGVHVGPVGKAINTYPVVASAHLAPQISGRLDVAEIEGV
jgi:hypothetical protein